MSSVDFLNYVAPCLSAVLCLVGLGIGAKKGFDVGWKAGFEMGKKSGEKHYPDLVAFLKTLERQKAEKDRAGQNGAS